MNSNDAARQSIDDLASRVEALERRTNDLALKGQILGSAFGKSGLDQFFGEPEFWENPYDVGQAECAKRCIQEAATAREACANITDSTARLACYESAAESAARCQAQCSSRFPPPIR